MRALSATLTAEQKADSRRPLFKLKLPGFLAFDIEGSTYGSAIHSEHTEEEYSQTAKVIIDNSATGLEGNDFQGLKGVISYGYLTDSEWQPLTAYTSGDPDYVRPSVDNGFVYFVTGSGTSGAAEPTWNTTVGGVTSDGTVNWETALSREYSACAPLWVLTQKNIAWGGGVAMELNLIGTPNRLAQDKASRAFWGDSGSLKTIRTLIREIAAGGFSQWVASTAYSLDDFVHPKYSTWAAATGYSIGDLVVSVDTTNTRIYTCTDALTSSATEPTWPMKHNDTVADGAGGGAGVWTLKDIKVFKCTVAGDSGGSQPSFHDTAIGATETDNEVTWTCEGLACDVFNHGDSYTVTFDSVDAAMDKTFYTWTADTVYALGDYVRPTVWNGLAFKATTVTGDGKSGGSEPTWDTDVGDTTADDQVTWTTENVGFRPADTFFILKGENRLDVIKKLILNTGCSFRVEADEAIHIFEPITEDRATTWAANSYYTLRDTVIPLTGAFVGRQFKCTTIGKSGATEPTWNVVLNGTTSDGTVTWTLAYDYNYVTPTSVVVTHNFYSKPFINKGSLDLLYRGVSPTIYYINKRQFFALEDMFYFLV